jgi:hypothetical protein
MKPKDKLEDQEKSSVVYKISCNNCTQHYIGETEKQLKTRLHEHQLCVKRKDHLSLVAQHSYENNHTFNFQEAEVIGMAKNRVTRQFKESWLSGSNSINRHVNLHPIYQALRYQLSENKNVPDNGNFHRNSELNRTNSTIIQNENNLASYDVIAADIAGDENTSNYVHKFANSISAEQISKHFYSNSNRDQKGEGEDGTPAAATTADNLPTCSWCDLKTINQNGVGDIKQLSAIENPSSTTTEQIIRDGQNS